MITETAERTEAGAAVRRRMPDADYTDAFRIETGGTRRTAEQWVRATLEGGGPPGSLAARLLGQIADRVVLRGVLGLRAAAPGTPGHVIGLPMVENEPDVVVLDAASSMMMIRIVLDVSDTHATMTSLLRFPRPAGRLAWAVIGMGHRALAPTSLAKARRTLSELP